MKKTVILNGIVFGYDLSIKRVKNINLRIKNDGSICVSSNRHVSLDEIERFLKSNAERIIKAVDKAVDTKNKVIYPAQYTSGEQMLLLGKVYELILQQGKNNCVYIRDKNIILIVKDTNNHSMKKTVFDNWLKAYSEDVIQTVCRRVYPFFKQKGIEEPIIKYRKMVSQWGNCRAVEGILTFNTMLVMAHERCIEYVVAHEFTHFLRADHSKAFYAQLSECMPDWKERKRLLADVQLPR